MNDFPFYVISLDLETQGTIPEYALQPWRFAQRDAEGRRKAWISTAAYSLRGLDGSMVSRGAIMPRRSQLAQVLELADRLNATVVTWNGVFDMTWLIAAGLRDLVFKVKWLDGMRLWKHLDLTSSFATADHTYALKGEAGAVGRWCPEMLGYEADIDYQTQDPEELRRLLAYNKADTAATLVATEKIWRQLDDRRRRAALIEAACFPMVAAANLEGMLVDKPAVKALDRKLVATATELGQELAQHGVTETVVRSPKQLSALMYDVWGLPQIKARSTDKDVLSQLASVDDRADKLRRFREALNLRGKFIAGIVKSVVYNEDGQTRPQANVFGTYCVPGDVEVLTRQGWTRLDAWGGGDIVQARPDLTMEFLPASRFEGPLVDTWVHIKNTSFDCRFTHGHTMPYLAQKTGKWRTKQAHEFLSGEAKAIPRAGVLKLDGQWSPDQMRMFAAIQADGYDSSKGVRFTFVKPRKVARMIALIDRLGLVARSYSCAAYPDRTEIIITKTNLPDWMKGRKTFGPWLLDTTSAGLQAFIQEIEFWDGSRHPDGGVNYASNNPTNVEWVVTIAALVGMRANLHKPQAQLKEALDMHPCHISETRTVSAIAPRYATEVSETHRAFCATTQTGFWLARSKGCVFITGNTSRFTYNSTMGKKGTKKERQTGFALHQMKRDKAFKNMIVAPEGHDLVEFDAAGQEFRWMAIASGDATMLQLCQPGEDAHSFMGSQISGLTYDAVRTGVKDSDATCKKIRQGGKVGNLCITADVVVLTDRGPVKIVDVTTADRVWDGIEFVNHDGVVCSGVKPVMSYMGLSATHKHEVMVDGEWQQIQDAARHGRRIQSALGQGWAGRGRAAVRIVDGLVRRLGAAVWRALRDDAVRLRGRARSGGQLPGDWALGAVQGMRSPAATSSGRFAHRDQRSRWAAPEAGQRNDAAVSQSEGRIVSELRGAWDRVQVRLDQRGGGLYQGAPSASDLPEAGHRPTEQRWSLRAWKLALGYTQGEPCQSETALVYDIVNCGPRTRFSANGLIVHNSLQYRTSPGTFQIRSRTDHDLIITLSEAEKICAVYKRSYPGVPQYWRRQIALGRSCGYAETLAGRRVQVRGNWDGPQKWAMESTMINYPTQGTSGEQKYLALRCLKDLLSSYDARFAWDLHDGLYFYVPKDKSLKFAHAMRTVLYNLPYDKAWGFASPIPLPWDAKIGPSWGALKEVE